MILLGLFVTCVLAATATELAEFQPVGRGLLILGRHVIPALTILTLKHNVIAWHLLNLKLLSTDYADLNLCNLWMKTIQQLRTPCRRRPCGRLHESRTANLSPSRWARSIRFPSPRCHPASPSRLPPANAPLQSRPRSAERRG